MLYLDMFDVLAVIGAMALGIAAAKLFYWFIKNYQIERKTEFIIHEKQPEEWQ